MTVSQKNETSNTRPVKTDYDDRFDYEDALAAWSEGQPKPKKKRKKKPTPQRVAPSGIPLTWYAHKKARDGDKTEYVEWDDLLDTLLLEGDAQYKRLIAGDKTWAIVQRESADIRRKNEARKTTSQPKLDDPHKEAARLFLPAASNDPDLRRAKNHVERVHILALDYDEYPSLAQLYEVWGEWEGIMTTSWSHETGKPKARVIVRLSRPIETSEFKQVFKWADTISSANGLKLDPLCSNHTRVWYPPCRKRKGYQQRKWAGNPLPVSSILAGALKEEEDGFKSSWGEFDEETIIVPAGGGKTNITTLAKAMKPGEKVQCHCPFVGEYTANAKPEDTNPKSAFVRRKGKGAIIVCTSANHGHDNPLVRQWKDPGSFALTTRTVQQDVLSLLKRVTNKAGVLKTLPTPSNLNIILTEDREFGERFWFDAFLRRNMFGTEPIAGTDFTHIRIWCEEVYNVLFERGDIKHAIDLRCSVNERHPFREELRALTWDGVPRLDTWLINACHIEDSELHRAYSAKWAIGAVRRIMNPGCKLDTVLVIKGPQAYKKSTLFRELAMSRFRDTYLDLNKMENSMQQLHGSWIYEWPELATISGHKQTNKLKSFITSQVDDFRSPYAPTVGSHPRQCVFVGTTNDDSFLHDRTGNRRFWVIEIDEIIDIEWVQENVAQMWAEAVAREAMAEDHYLSREMEEESNDRAETYVAEDPIQAKLTSWAARNDKTWGDFEALLLASGLRAGDRSASTIIGTALAAMGWVKHRFRVGSSRLVLWHDPKRIKKSEAATEFKAEMAVPPTTVSTRSRDWN